MSEKDLVDFIDFERILEELEKIKLPNAEGSLGNSFPGGTLRENFKQMEAEAKKQAKEDTNSVFYTAVGKGIETLNSVPIPLTEKESIAFDEKHATYTKKIELVKKKAEYAKKLLRKEIDKEKGFTMDLSERGRLKKTAKRFFGKKMGSITYLDYIVAREVRDSFAESETKDLMEDDE